MWSRIARRHPPFVVYRGVAAAAMLAPELLGSRAWQSWSSAEVRARRVVGRFGRCSRTADTSSSTRNRLVSCLAWHALEQGIRTYTGVAEIAWLQQILAFGWDCRPLGAPVRHVSGMLGALAIEISPETPDLLAANGIWELAGEAAAPIPHAA